MIGDPFFVFVSIVLFLSTGSFGIYSLLCTKTFGDPLGELENYGSEELAASASALHMFAGICMIVFAVYSVTVLPTWTKQEPLPQDEYTYQLQPEETVFATDFDTLETDYVKWANLARQPEKICVYRVTSYNFLGMWPEIRMSIDEAPCEKKSKYEF